MRCCLVLILPLLVVSALTSCDFVIAVPVTKKWISYGNVGLRVTQRGDRYGGKLFWLRKDGSPFHVLFRHADGKTLYNLKIENQLQGGTGDSSADYLAAETLRYAVSSQRQDVEAGRYQVRDLVTGTEEIGGKTFHKLECYIIFPDGWEARAALFVVGLPPGPEFEGGLKVITAHTLMLHYQAGTASPPLGGLSIEAGPHRVLECKLARLEGAARLPAGRNRMDPGVAESLRNLQENEFLE